MKRFFAIFLLAAAITLSGCGKKQVETPYTVNLEMWGLFDDSEAFAESIKKYDEINGTHTKVVYKKKQEATYKDDLLRAFAAGNAPDIFLIRNSWFGDFSEFVAPLPESLTNEKEIRDTFVDTALRDSFIDGKLYGAPLSVDSLALYYNKDLFNAAGIITPPSTWDEVASIAKRFTVTDLDGMLVRSGIALGTGKNVNRASDILLAMAFQHGLAVKGALFTDTTEIASKPMQDSLQFLSQFSRIGSESYTWNSRQHYSMDAFYEGTLAMMVNYSWKMDEIKRKNAKFNFGVAPLPQFDPNRPVNMANYWTFVVAKKKDLNDDQKGFSGSDQYNNARVHESWQFLRYLAFPHQNKQITLQNALDKTVKTVPMEFDPAKAYIEKTRKPAGRKDLAEAQQKSDPNLSPFAYGNLIAKSWRQFGLEQAEEILNEAIESVARGETTPGGALGLAETQVGLLNRSIPTGK